MTSERRRAWELEGLMETLAHTGRLEIPVKKLMALLGRTNTHPAAWPEIREAYEAVDGDPDDLRGRIFDGTMLLLTTSPMLKNPLQRSAAKENRDDQ